MAKKYESVYVGLAELIMELGDRPTFEEKGKFIDEVARCIILQKKGVNDYADRLMAQSDEFREENRRRVQAFRDRQKEADAQQTPLTGDNPPPAIQEREPAKPARKTREKKDKGELDPDKKPYGQFENVFLTDKEVATLQKKFGDRYGHALEILSAYKKSSGKKYESDFGAFYSWVVRRLNEEDQAQQSGNVKSFRQIDKDDAARMAREEFPGVMESFGL